MSVSNPEKGARYLASLDQALCNGHWNEISELARKVDKHAPDRKCLTLAARAEAQVITASHRPTSASSVASVSIHGLGELVPNVVEAISAARKSHADDAFVASVCLAEIHWLREAPVEALKVLSDIGDAPAASQSGPGPLGWLEVCAVKARFINASCLDSSGQTQEAREAFESSARQTPGYRTPELRRWTERLLARACMYSVQKIPSPSLQDYSKTYAVYKAWGAFWQRAPPSSTEAGTGTTRLDLPRRQVWKAYYDLLSTILQHGLTIGQSESRLLIPSQSDAEDDHQSAAKHVQRSEIQQVEATYESLLLAETQFPKASQINKEVEEWVEQVVSNWRVFSGPSWTDSDIGEGGKRAISQTVLNILYRAATKTFHSTPILRHLFTVHAARGEFDLAMHAFDSYIEIIDRAKARAEKTGKHEIGSDDDDTAMLTAAEAVRLLCRYGDREQAKRALDITKAMQKWIGTSIPSTEDAVHTNGAGEHEEPPPHATKPLLKTDTFAAVYRAMGIGQAHWAQVTYESETRASLLADANNNLRRAQKFDETSVETAHALAFVLAQMRDVSGSLEVIRAAVAAKDHTSNGDADSSAVIERQKQLMPLWHLLALCLTAEDEFEAASSMCEAAYRPFGDMSRLFGAESNLSTSNSEKLSATTSSVRAIVDQMDNCEKESMVQMKMTQITLFELMEGPDDAVDQTDELLGLYSRLFGKPEQVVAEILGRPPQTSASQAPSRLGGTLRSITGSIRPRSTRSVRSSVEKDTPRQRSVISEETYRPTRNGTATTNGTGLGPPIAITVTNEDGVNSAERSHHRHPHLPHLPFTNRGQRSASVGSRSPARSTTSVNNEKPPLDPAAVSNQPKPDQPLGSIAHNASSNKLPPPQGQDTQPPQQDVRLPVPHPTSASAVPEPQLAPIHERRHKLTVLIDTWLFSAELYTRAENFDDADNLISDAVKLTETLERELAASEAGSSAKRLFHKGWGKGKSVDELWADVWSTKARLALARQLPYDAMAAYEQALFHSPDHPSSIVGLSTLLMDIFEEKLPAEPPLTSTQPLPTASGSLIKESRPALTRPSTATTLPSRRPSVIVEPEPMEKKERKVDPTPAALNRLAARDRAYMLLSNLTKQGVGWDDSEAWLTLARAHELSREIGKAKQALWWVVELENNRPIRPWKDACPGGLTV